MDEEGWIPGWRLARTLVFARLAFCRRVALPPPPCIYTAAAVVVFMMGCLRQEEASPDVAPGEERRRRRRGRRRRRPGFRVGRRWAAAVCGKKRVGAEGSTWARWIEGARAAVEGANFLLSPSYPSRNERPDVYWYRAVPVPTGTLCWTTKVQLLIYFMLKYAMEILLSESSVVTTYYFNWSTSAVAIFLAILGCTVLPVNAIVGSYITNLFEDRQILVASEIMVLIGIIMSFRYTLHYSVPQYVLSALITFVFAEVLEGVNLSLLSRVMSSRLARGTYNGGLLSTEAGTLARVVADATITAAGYLSPDLLLNITLLPPLVICIASLVATFCTYNTLY